MTTPAARRPRPGSPGSSTTPPATSSAPSPGRRAADKAVVPTLALGAVALATVGARRGYRGRQLRFRHRHPHGGAHRHADLASLSAQQGILVKDGRALELMRGRYVSVRQDRHAHPRAPRGRTGDRLHRSRRAAVLRYAAAAEQKFTHPIARAILDRAEALRLTLPPIDESTYRVGYGITVGIEDRTCPSAARASWPWKGSTFRRSSSVRWRRLTARAIP